MSVYQTINSQFADLALDELAMKLEELRESLRASDDHRRAATGQSIGTFIAARSALAKAHGEAASHRRALEAAQTSLCDAARGLEQKRRMHATQASIYLTTSPDDVTTPPSLSSSSETPRPLPPPPAPAPASAPSAPSTPEAAAAALIAAAEAAGPSHATEFVLFHCEPAIDQACGGQLHLFPSVLLALHSLGTGGCRDDVMLSREVRGCPSISHYTSAVASLAVETICETMVLGARDMAAGNPGPTPALAAAALARINMPERERRAQGIAPATLAAITAPLPRRLPVNSDVDGLTRLVGVFDAGTETEATEAVIEMVAVAAGALATISANSEAPVVVDLGVVAALAAAMATGVRQHPATTAAGASAAAAFAHLARTCVLPMACCLLSPFIRELEGTTLPPPALPAPTPAYLRFELPHTHIPTTPATAVSALLSPTRPRHGHGASVLPAMVLPRNPHLSPPPQVAIPVEFEIPPVAAAFVAPLLSAETQTRSLLAATLSQTFGRAPVPDQGPRSPALVAAAVAAVAGARAMISARLPPSLVATCKDEIACGVLASFVADAFDGLGVHQQRLILRRLERQVLVTN